MTAESLTYNVFVGRPTNERGIIEYDRRGEVFKKNSRWRWLRPGAGGVETYPPRSTMADVRSHIARLFCANPERVLLNRKRDA